jgi:SAM-dependent methyltransferase
MPDQESPESGHSLDEFLGEPTRDLSAWRWLWETDHPFPIHSHRGGLGGIVVFLKRLFRPFVKVPQNDLWERQRVFNLIVVEALERLHLFEPLLAEIDRLRWNAQEYKDLTVYLTRFIRSGVSDIVSHNDALFSRVDQKLDRYRRESRQLWSSLGSALAAAEAGENGVPELARAWDEQAYLDLEDRHRGTQEEIADRFAVYLDRLPGSGAVLDLGCGRGETLAVLRNAGYDARGVDRSRRMVELCREKGLDAEEDDLIDALVRQEEGSLAAVVSLHVIEHLPPAVVERLVRLAYRALVPGGALVLETPNPLSMIVAARNFWLDPTHQRPVHPESLEAMLDSAGFDELERLDLRPFEQTERLPEISLDGLEGDSRQLADAVNRLRDQLDAMIFGYQDYGLVGLKPRA